MTQPQSAPDPLTEATALHKAGKLQQAETAYRAIMPGHPGYGGAQYRLGILHVQTGRPGEALAFFNAAIQAEPGNIEFINGAGAGCMQAGKLEDAEALLRKGLSINPVHAGTLNNLANLLSLKGASDKAEALFRRAAVADPNNPEILHNLGVIRMRDDAKEAEKLFRDAIRLKPDYAQAWNHLAYALDLMHRAAEAEEAYRTALRLAPHMGEAWGNLGNILRFKGKVDEALSAYENAILHAPKMAMAYDLLCALLENANRLEAIPGVLEKARQNIPGDPVTLLLEAKIERHRKDFDKAIALLEPYVGREDSAGMKIGYELGRLYDSAGRHDDAYKILSHANRLMESVKSFQAIDRDSIFTDIDRAEGLLNLVPLENWTPPMPSPENPVFLVGFPRSGTTLLDQILTSHSDIFVAEEVPAFHLCMDYIKDPPYPAFLPTLTEKDIREMRSLYFGAHHEDHDWQKRKIFVDKLPLNHINLPLIHRLFPKAKIIVALRHPNDCVLSCFMQEFRPNVSNVQFTDLDRTAKLYARSMDLLALAQEKLPLEFHTVRYEDILGDFRGSIEPLLNFLGVDWQESVLKYDETARNRTLINTPSATQVTQKIYDHAKYRWKHYEEYLKPVFPILEPYIRRFGY